jgi:uncharacterized SAM-binding protein YcdF (DUF218 family)
MFFTLKKILSALLQPYCLGLEFLIFGLVLLWFTRHQRPGKIVVAAALLLLLMPGLSPLSDSLLRSLEVRYPPALYSQPGSPPVPVPGDIRLIAVLGGGFTPDDRLPVTSGLSSESLARLTEAVRLYRMLPGSRLILSGGAVYSGVPESEGLAQTARIMGVPVRDLLQESRSRDTEEQALLLKPFVENAPFLLVTSAVHMTRTMAIFQKQGMVPIPAPAAFMAHARQDSDPAMYFPKTSALSKSEMVFHEYLGLLWYRLSGRL